MKTFLPNSNLSVPTNWQEFLDCCAVLKSNGIQPLISGNKDSFVLQFGIYQIAASQVYAKNPDYNAQLTQGKPALQTPEPGMRRSGGIFSSMTKVMCSPTP